MTGVQTCALPISHPASSSLSLSFRLCTGCEQSPIASSSLTHRTHAISVNANDINSATAFLYIFPSPFFTGRRRYKSLSVISIYETSPENMSYSESISLLPVKGAPFAPHSTMGSCTCFLIICLVIRKRQTGTGNRHRKR